MHVGVQAKRVTLEGMSHTICIFIIVDTQTVLSRFIARFCDLASWLLLSMLVVIVQCIFEAVRLILSNMATAWTGKTGRLRW